MKCNLTSSTGGVFHTVEQIIPCTSQMSNIRKIFHAVCTHLSGGWEHYDPGEQNSRGNQVVEGVQAFGTADLHRQLPGGRVERHFQAERGHQQHHSTLTSWINHYKFYIDSTLHSEAPRCFFAHLVIGHAQKGNSGVEEMRESAVVMSLSWSRAVKGKKHMEQRKTLCAVTPAVEGYGALPSLPSGHRCRRGGGRSRQWWIEQHLWSARHQSKETLVSLIRG